MKSFYKFSGYITDIEEDEFCCFFEDVSDPTQPDSLITLDSKMIRDIDKKWYIEGAWVDFYIRLGNNSDNDKVVLRFKKRFWTQADIDEAEKIAAEWAELFDWE